MKRKKESKGQGKCTMKIEDSYVYRKAKTTVTLCGEIIK